MNRNGMAFWVVVCLLLLPLVASAQKNSIYSWTDENGVKHFSDRAPVETEAAVEEIPVAEPPATAPDENSATLNNEVLQDDPTDPAAVDATQELSYADQQRLAMEEKRQAQREKQTERQRICLQAQDQLAQIEPSRRVFYTDESGNTTRLDDEQRVQMVDENKKLVAEYCD
jgi:hypothetical protein